MSLKTQNIQNLFFEIIQFAIKYLDDTQKIDQITKLQIKNIYSHRIQNDRNEKNKTSGCPLKSSFTFQR